MKLPWKDKTGLAKAATICATVLLISLGLCGLNYAAINGIGAPYKTHQQALNIAETILIVAAYAESLAILLSVAGLVLCLLTLLLQDFLRLFTPKK